MYDTRLREAAAYRLCEAGLPNFKKAGRLLRDLGVEGAPTGETIRRWYRKDKTFRALVAEKQAELKAVLTAARGQAETERMRRLMLGSHAEGLREDDQLLQRMREKVKAIVDGGEVKSEAMLNAFTGFLATLDKRHERTWHVIGGDADATRLLDAVEQVLREQEGPEKTTKMLKVIEARYLALTQEVKRAAEAAGE